MTRTASCRFPCRPMIFLPSKQSLRTKWQLTVRSCYGNVDFTRPMCSGVRARMQGQCHLYPRMIDLLTTHLVCVHRVSYMHCGHRKLFARSSCGTLCLRQLLDLARVYLPVHHLNKHARRLFPNQRLKTAQHPFLLEHTLCRLGTALFVPLHATSA